MLELLVLLKASNQPLSGNHLAVLNSELAWEDCWCSLVLLLELVVGVAHGLDFLVRLHRALFEREVLVLAHLVLEFDIQFDLGSGCLHREGPRSCGHHQALEARVPI